MEHLGCNHFGTCHGICPSLCTHSSWFVFHVKIWRHVGISLWKIGIWCVEWWWSFSPQFQWWAVWELSLRPFPPAIKHVTWQCEIPEQHVKLNGKLCINRRFFHVKCVSKNGFYLDSNQQKHICKVDAANISITRVLYCSWHSVRLVISKIGWYSLVSATNDTGVNEQRMVLWSSCHEVAKLNIMNLWLRKYFVSTISSRIGRMVHPPVLKCSLAMENLLFIHGFRIHTPFRSGISHCNFCIAICCWSIPHLHPIIPP